MSGTPAVKPQPGPSQVLDPDDVRTLANGTGMAIVKISGTDEARATARAAIEEQFEAEPEP